MYEKKNLLKKCNKTEILLTLVQTKQLLLWVLKVFKEKEIQIKEKKKS